MEHTPQIHGDTVAAEDGIGNGLAVPESSVNMAQDPKKIKGVSYGKWGYLFIAPFFIIFLIFQLYPMLYTLILSFTDLSGWKTELHFIGFENFRVILSDLLFWQSIGNTFIIWIINFVPQMFFALLFAAMFTTQRLKLHLKGFFKVVYFLPSIITAASVSVLFYQLFNYPSGSLYVFFSNLGLIPQGFNFYLDNWSARLLVSFIQFWMWFGNTMVILIAGILGVDPSLYEAAELDGASKARQFFSITLPLIKPIMLYTLITSLVGGLQMFDIPYLFLSGGPNNATQTISVYIYKFAFDNRDRFYNYASAASVMLMLIAVVLCAALWRIFYGKKEKA